MLVLVFGFWIFAFLILGAGAFIVSITTPRLRRYALSAALWFATLGPCVVALMMLAGLALLAQQYANAVTLDLRHLAPAPKVVWSWFLVLGLIGAASTATALAWIHQLLIHRLTFALFRIYATLVCTGIGSVLALLTSWVLLINDVPWTPAIGLFAAVALCVGFGRLGFLMARELRGDPPNRSTWITPDEFIGADAPSQM